MKNRLIKKGLSLVLSAVMAASFAFTVNASDDVLSVNENNSVRVEKDTSSREPSIDTLDEESHIAIVDRRTPENEFGISPMSVSSNDGFYQSFSGYITQQGGSQYLFPIEVYPNEVIHGQLDLPATSQVDYDLYLHVIDANANILSTPDYSDYATYLNGTSTLSEAVGHINTTNSVAYYALEVRSYMGSSINMPFTLHLGINDVNDMYEADENSWYAVGVTLQTNAVTSINVRSADTLIDNDWYTITIPGNLNYSSATFSLDNASVAAGYKVEVYSELSGQIMKKESNTLTLTSGNTHFIRVTTESANYLTGSNYTLNITPGSTGGTTNPTSCSIVINSISGFESATYNSVTRYRINQNSTATFNGKVTDNNGLPVAGEQVTVTIENTSVSTTSPNRYKTGTGTTDANGNFTASVTTGTAMGANSAYLSGAIPFWHYYDSGKFYATLGTSKSSETQIYMFAYSVKA